MKIKVERFYFTEKCTIGKLTLPDGWTCYTLEDKFRDDGIKVLGQTAIPYGVYEVVIDFSGKFRRPMPHILNVPSFQGIRIHWGNTSSDTEGCLLLGTTCDKTHGFVGGSRAAFQVFFEKLGDALKSGNKCFIEIMKKEVTK